MITGYMVTLVIMDELSLDDRMPFGPMRGELLEDVIEEDPVMLARLVRLKALYLNEDAIAYMQDFLNIQ